MAPVASTAARSCRAFSISVALSLAGCSSSDDVVAVSDELSLREPTTNGGGTPLQTGVLSVRDPAATPGAVASGTSLLPPSPGSSLPPNGLPPLPVASSAIDDPLFVSGVPLSPPVVDAERWPLAQPLREFFLGARDDQTVVIQLRGLPARPLRELGADYGLRVGSPPVIVPVEDDVGEQFQLSLSEDPLFSDD